MQLLAALDAKLELIHTHPCVRSVAPAVSEYCRANIWLTPLPELGVTESAVTVIAAAGTVHVPKVCQPLFTLPFVPYMYTFFVPAYPVVNPIAKLKIRWVPETVTELVLRFTEHWLLLRLPLLPTFPAA